LIGTMAHAAVARMNPTEPMSAHLADIEGRLAELEAAFASGDAQEIEQQSLQLQRSLADSLAAFRKAEQIGVGALSTDLVNRLKLAQARIQAQQVAVHRAVGSIDRTLNVLFANEDNGGTYGNLGQTPAAKALKAYR
jgi:hypothetical protein